MSQRLSDLIDRLQRAGLEVDAEDLADILWLAQQIQAADDRPSESIASALSPEVEPFPPLPELEPWQSPDWTEPIAPEPAAIITLPPSPAPDPADQGVEDDADPSRPDAPTSTKPPPPDRSRGLPFRAPAAPALRQVRQLERALRPLARKVASHHAYELDEAATVEQSADLKCWLPVLQPARERWLDVALVVEQSPAIDLWRSLVNDWQALLGRSGAFRDVRVWWLREESGQIAIAPHPNGPVSSPRQLLDPSGRRLILFMSDCTSGLWRSNPAVDDHSSNDWPANSLQAVLKLWAAKGALTLVQWLPEWLWRRTALGAAYWVQLSATMPGQASDRLAVSGLPVWEDVETAGSLRLPVVTIEPGPLARWARLVAGAGDALSAGVLFEPGTVWQPPMADPNDHPDPEMIVRQFWAVASPLAKQLAGYMAAVPVSWEVLHLIQAELLPESNQVHGAEVFMGGLMERVGDRYDFREGVRSWLVDSMPRSQTEQVLDAVSDQIAKRFGLTARGFRALLLDGADLPEGAIAEVQAFARIARSTLLWMGGEFAALGDRLDPEVVGMTSPPPPDKGLKPLAPTMDADQADAEQTYPDGYIDVFEKEFLPNPVDLPEVSQEIVESSEPIQQEFGQQEQSQTQQFAQHLTQAEQPDPFVGWSLREWSFETVRVDRTGRVVERLPKTARSHFVDLGEGVKLEMVAIPGGQFQMGSPKEEERRDSDEGPVRTVTVPPLLMSRYPITVQQWRRVAGRFPAVLNPKLNADPSKWKDATGPVERVNWFDAMEFCARLSKATDRLYRLPSEAEWEYGCRAGTQTPFAFGETLRTDLANYDGNATYAEGPKGEYRQRTTPVGQFPPNGFGLQDMHGNVWEWCLDDWHENYQSAPVDGRPSLDSSTHEKILMHKFQESKKMNNVAFQNLTDVDNKQPKLLRGGSWFDAPWHCCSANRDRWRTDNRDGIIGGLIGFRVVVLP